MRPQPLHSLVSQQRLRLAVLYLALGALVNLPNADLESAPPTHTHTTTRRRRRSASDLSRVIGVVELLWVLVPEVPTRPHEVRGVGGRLKQAIWKGVCVGPSAGRGFAHELQMLPLSGKVRILPHGTTVPRGPAVGQRQRHCFVPTAAPFWQTPKDHILPGAEPLGIVGAM